MKLILLRSFTTLITLFIGISATAFWLFINPSESDLTSRNVVFDSTIEQDRVPQINKLKQNNGEIEIKYAWSLLGLDSLEGFFVVKNNTGKTIYYPGYPNAINQENQRSWIKQKGKIKATIIGSKDLIKEQELKSGESITFSLLVPQNYKPFEAGFGFRIDGEQNEKIIWVKVKKQLKSFGGGCSKEIEKLGNPLAEVDCIEVEPDLH